MHLFLFFAYLFASGQERGDLSGSSIAKPANPVREGYTFEGWFTDAEGKNAFNFETAKPETDTVIYARCTRILTALDASAKLRVRTSRSETGVLSGTFRWDAVEAGEGKVSGYGVTLTDPDGIDWTQGGMAGTQTEFATALTKEGDWTITVTAVGSEENGSSDSQSATLTVRLTFDAPIEEESEDVLCLCASSITKLSDPVRTGYTSEGWFTEESCTNKFDFAQANRNRA